MDLFLEAGALLVLLVFFSVFSYRKGALDFEGVIIGNIIGIIIFLFGGLTYFLIILFFFVVAEACTRIARKELKEKHGKRTTGNILGNSAVAVLALAFGSGIGFFGAVSAALSDTLSSEIGLLSRKKPVLITSFKEVEPGTDGGITALGSLAGLVGAVLIALIHFYLNADVFAFLVITAAGVIGSIVDSILGATLERKNMLNNTMVNFFGSSAGAVFAAVALVLMS